MEEIEYTCYSSYCLECLRICSLCITTVQIQKAVSPYFTSLCLTFVLAEPTSSLMDLEMKTISDWND